MQVLAVDATRAFELGKRGVGVLAASFILEEGYPLADLKRIVESMARAAREANVAIVTGDTKVVEQGKGDGVFITTTGVGVVDRIITDLAVHPNGTIYVVSHLPQSYYYRGYPYAQERTEQAWVYSFNVADPNAGTLSGGGDVCNTTGEVVLTATPNGDSNTPDGYSLAYVLTSGTDLVIQQLGASPSFTVTTGGLYTIHTFVFPSDLDLSVVVRGRSAELMRK